MNRFVAFATFTFSVSLWAIGPQSQSPDSSLPKDHAQTQPGLTKAESKNERPKSEDAAPHRSSRSYLESVIPPEAGTEVVGNKKEKGKAGISAWFEGLEVDANGVRTFKDCTIVKSGNGWAITRPAYSKAVQLNNVSRMTSSPDEAGKLYVGYSSPFELSHEMGIYYGETESITFDFDDAGNIKGLKAVSSQRSKEIPLGEGDKAPNTVTNSVVCTD